MHVRFFYKLHFLPIVTQINHSRRKQIRIFPAFPWLFMSKRGINLILCSNRLAAIRQKIRFLSRHRYSFPLPPLDSWPNSYYNMRFRNIFSISNSFKKDVRKGITDRFILRNLQYNYTGKQWFCGTWLGNRFRIILLCWIRK